MRIIAEKARIIAEVAGGLPLAAALTGKADKGPIVCIVSGGNLDLKKFCELIDLSRRSVSAKTGDAFSGGEIMAAVRDIFSVRKKLAQPC